MGKDFILPGTRRVYEPDRAYLPRHVRIEVELDVPQRSVSGTVTTRLEPVAGAPPPRRIVLDAEDLAIAEVTADGRALEHHHDGRRLVITPHREGAIELVVRYEARPRRGLYFLEPDAEHPDRPRQVWTQGQDEDARCWFPCVDAPGVKATTEVLATVPHGWTVLSNGVLVSDRADEVRGTRTVHHRLDVPHPAYLVSLVAGELIALRERAGEVELLTLAPPGREEDARRTVGRTGEMIALFERRFGVPYPYPGYAQAFVADFIFGGMENTSATTLTDRGLMDARAALDFNGESLIAHELAHQWFGDLVTCREWSEGWLNEGFATYCEQLWREHEAGLDEADRMRVEESERYLHEAAERYQRPVVERCYHAPIDIFDAHLYEKGGLVLHMLRGLCGDEPFFAAVGRYLERHRFGVAETRDLQRALEEHTGKSLAWFFDQWIHRAGHPEVAVKIAWDDATARLGVHFAQKLEGGAAPYRLPVEVLVEHGGRVDRFACDIDAPERGFSFPLAGPPGMVIVDPGARLLVGWRVDKPKPMWKRELAAAERAVDRARAARELGKDADRATVDALVRALGSDAFWAVRAEAARALGPLRTVRARQALVAALADTHPKVRRAAVRALGEQKGDADAIAAVQSLASRGDASYFVEGEAAAALVKLRAPGALDAVGRVLDRPGWNAIVARLAVDALPELWDEPRALQLAIDATAAGRHPMLRMSGAGALGRGFVEHRAARHRLTELLADADFFARLAAARACGAGADARLLGDAEAALAREHDDRIRRALREATRDLREGHAREEQLRLLRRDLDELRGEQAGLRARLEALEPPPTPASASGRRASRSRSAPKAKRGARPKAPPRGRGRR